MTKSYFKVCSAGGAYFFFHDGIIGRRDALRTARDKVKELMRAKGVPTPPPPIEDGEIPRKIERRTPALSSWLPDPDVQRIGETL
jgi:hypothetical protein